MDESTNPMDRPERDPTSNVAGNSRAVTDGQRAEGQAPAGAAVPLPAALDTEPRDTQSGRSRRILPWAITAAAVLVAAIAITALVVNESSEPRPVAQLPLQADVVPDGVPVDEETIANWNLADADFVYYGSYGEAELWSTTSLEDRRCLAVVVQGDTWMFRCTPPTMDTVAVIDAPPPVVPPAPSGEPASVVQFVLHDDTVDVYLAPKPEGGFY